MIKSILDSEAVGNYAVAVRISEAFYFIPMAVSSSLFPAIINAKQMDTTLYFNDIQRLYDLMTWMGVAIALPTTILADGLITHLFGDKYLFAAGALKIHIWAGVFVFLGVASGKWLVAENLQKYSFYRTLIGMIVNVVLNLVFIPKYGIKGAAYATVLSYLSAVYLSMAFIRPIRKNFWMATKSFNPVAARKRIFNVYG
jgi:O-antigen/teichoic acid export membrane protein